MKSSIKVDYKSRFGEHFPEKEPIIKVVLEKSDDPRDTLLGEIFDKDPFCKRIGISRISEDPETYTIYKRSDREYKINDIFSPAFTTLCKYSGIAATMVTSSDKMWFELEGNPRIKSKGFDKLEFYKTAYCSTPSAEGENAAELRLFQAIVEDWKDFEKLVNRERSK